ncbi:MAG: hypothetical protein JO122_05910 [Acetobacteraceae bacterium]|nr:hypothetical protein [Acetobacteraceae bacterium]
MNLTSQARPAFGPGAVTENDSQYHVTTARAPDPDRTEIGKMLSGRHLHGVGMACDEAEGFHMRKMRNGPARHKRR